MSYEITLIDETWGETTPVRKVKVLPDLATTKAAVALWANAQCEHVRKDGHKPTVDTLPVSDYPASAIVSWVVDCELIVTLVLTAIEVKD